MIPKSSVKPLELVISAIHCLKEKKGSSPQNILKYLIRKYNVNPKALKTHVQAGLKRGLSFGLITQKSGLYCLNDVLSSPSNVSKVKCERKLKFRLKRRNASAKKKQFKRSVKKGKRKLDKHTTCASLKYKRKAKKSKEKKYRKKKKPACNGDNLRRNLTKTKRRKSNPQKIKAEKVQKPKVEKVKKPTPEKDLETSSVKTESSEVQRCTASNKELHTNIKE